MTTSKITLGLMSSILASLSLTHCRQSTPSVIRSDSSKPGTSSQLVSNGFLVNQNSAARAEAKTMRTQNHPDTKYVELVANHTIGVWYGAWSGDIQTAVRAQASAALSHNATALMIPYNIPYRDCGSHSAGGLPADQYRNWIGQFAAAVGQAKAIIILEPDAVALTECLNAQTLAERFELLTFAVQAFASKAPNARVYIDAGHPAWLATDKAADRLKKAGIAKAAGFALNTSNYFDNQRVIAYGNQISALVKKNFVIDSSRNGRGSAGDNEWCNPAGRGLGILPTMQTGTPGVDAFLWIKSPGESDGTCAGGPAAGNFWRERAIELARNAKLDLPGDSGSGTQQDQNPPTTTVPGGAPSEPKPTPAPQPKPTGTSVPERGRPESPAPQPTPSPSPSPNPIPSPSPSPSPSAGNELSASINVKSSWQGGYCADLIVSNDGNSAVSSWTLVLDLNGNTLTQQWNLNVSISDNSVTMKPIAEWNARIAPQASVNQQGFCVDTNNSSEQASIGSVY